MFWHRGGLDSAKDCRPPRPSESAASYARRLVRGAAVSGLVATAFLTGCGPKSDRLALEGKVTLDGNPLDNGSIRFTSEGAVGANKKSYAVGASIEKGEYHVAQDKGAPPGTYRIEISAVDPKAPHKFQRSAPGQPGVMTAVEIIPADYNTQSKHTVEVSATGDNRFNFDISSKPAK